MADWTVGEIVAAVVLIQSAMSFIEKLIDKVTKPHKDLATADCNLQKNMETQDRRIENLEKELVSVNKKLSAVMNDNKMMMRTSLDMMEHMITGNHQEAMKETIKDLQNYLLEKAN